MADTLVRAIIHVDKEFLPIVAQCLGVNGITVVLRGDVAIVGSYHAHRLVV